MEINILFQPFHAAGLFQSSWKHLKNQRFSNDFWGYQKRPVAWNGLTGHKLEKNVQFHDLNNANEANMLTTGVIFLHGNYPRIITKTEKRMKNWKTYLTIKIHTPCK